MAAREVDNFPIDYPVNKDIGYALRLRTIFTQPYRTVLHVRQTCPDTSLQMPMYISHDSKNLNVSDCAMDIIDIFKAHRVQSCTHSPHPTFMASVGIVMCIILLVFSAVYNNRRQSVQTY